MSQSSPISPEIALIYAMVLISASDSKMSDEELIGIGNIVKSLPVFKGFDNNNLVPVAQSCAEILAEEEGLRTVLKLIAETLPEGLRETAYAVAVDVAVADGQLRQEELRVLELLRHELPVDRLEAAAIERGAKARHATL